MSEENGFLYELQPSTCTPFCLKTSDGIIHNFDGWAIFRKIERDDIQVIVTKNPGQGNREQKLFFPLGSRGIEIIYGRRAINRVF